MSDGLYLPSLVSLFSAAGLDKVQWLEALEQLAFVTGSSRAQLIGVGAPHGVTFNWVTGISQEILEEFEALDGGNPLVNPRVAAGLKAPELAVVSEVDYDREALTIDNRAYADFVERADYPFGCQTNLIAKSDLLVGLSILRSRQEGRTTAVERQVLSAVAPYARAAAVSQLALEGEAELVVQNALDKVRAAIFLCDRIGKVRGMSPAAEALVGAGGPLRLNEGRLGAAEQGDAVLQRSLAQVASQPHVMLVLPADRDGQEPLGLDIFRMPGWGWSLGFSVHSLIVVRSASHNSDEISRVLSAPQGAEPLTQREKTCLQLISHGMRVGAIAEHLDLASVTIELYLKNARRKLNAKTLPEAVARAILTRQIKGDYF
ncbi:helix-turn-helix transcriptional regulator [uncultured Caulobacter sp.]|uniref:helix-turn-helix transcriptional regulator n=1 Tax=uncultured Caulobacter sp. TaxID=158749 RepID=UPI0026036845|nr:helix-turn-helix transcriptional regulator [uncultured Caulobacter sp.]